MDNLKRAYDESACVLHFRYPDFLNRRESLDLQAKANNTPDICMFWHCDLRLQCPVSVRLCSSVADYLERLDAMTREMVDVGLHGEAEACSRGAVRCLLLFGLPVRCSLI